MQIRCAACGRVVTLVATGVLPDHCPHCTARPVPEEIGGYAIVRLLAAGGMGEVYLARGADGGDVAIKLLPPPVAEDAAALRERFAREARLQSAVDHPGVVPVLACDVLGDRPYLVLEYVCGQSLRERLADGPLPIEEAVRIVADVADVLAAAHGKGVLHRDIKPENVLIGQDDRVRVLDFGIARARDGEAPVTRTGEIIGTPQYMAPEQILDAGEEVDERCDVHALGVLAYELLTGQAPFQGANVFAVLKLVESLVPKAPSISRPEVPAAVDAVVAKAMAKDREARWPSAAELAVALRAAVANRRLPVVAPGAAPSRWLWMTLAAVVGVLLAWNWGLALRWVGGAVSDDDRGPEPPPTASERVAERRQRGRELLQLGAYHAAVFELEGLGGAAREDARVAWLCAYELLPLCIDAPRYWIRCDDVRRDRLFGVSAEQDGVADADDAAALLAHGRANQAWAALQPALAQPVGERPPHTATLALLAAHHVCRDRRVLRAVTERLTDAAPDVRALLRLNLLSRDDEVTRRQALLARAARLPQGGPDAALTRLMAAALASDATEVALRGLADAAWLAGAGEAAPVWFVGARLRQARRAGVTMAADEVERHQKLLAGAGPDVAPAVTAQERLLEVHAGGVGLALMSERSGALPPPLLIVAGGEESESLRDTAAAHTVARVVVGLEPVGEAYVKAFGLDPLQLPTFFFDCPGLPEILITMLNEAPGGTRDADHQRFAWLTLLACAGYESDPAQQPWSMLNDEPWRRRWLEEVCGGVQ